MNSLLQQTFFHFLIFSVITNIFQSYDPISSLLSEHVQKTSYSHRVVFAWNSLQISKFRLRKETRFYLDYCNIFQEYIWHRSQILYDMLVDTGIPRIQGM